MVLFDVRSPRSPRCRPSLGRPGALVVDTAVRHSNADAGYATGGANALRRLRFSACQPSRGGHRRVAELAASSAIEGLLGRRARHVFTENARVTRAVALLRAGRSHELGPLLTASHARCATTSRSPRPELDVAVDAATRGGGAGGTLIGGGFGGYGPGAARLTRRPTVMRRESRAPTSSRIGREPASSR